MKLKIFTYYQEYILVRCDKAYLHTGAEYSYFHCLSFISAIIILLCFLLFFHNFGNMPGTAALFLKICVWWDFGLLVHGEPRLNPVKFSK